MHLPPAMRVVRAVRRYFTLEHEKDAVSPLSAEVRERARSLSQLARQKRVAADAVRRAGSRGEAIGILRDAVRLALEAARVAGVALDEQLEMARIDDALARAEAPILDSEYVPAHTTLYRELAEAYVAVEELITPFRRSDRERERLATVRVALVLFGIATTVSAGVARARKPPPVYVQASAFIAKKWIPENVVDGDERTEWLLPDFSPGWLDVSPGRPRPIRAIMVLNSKNRPAPDRAIVDYRIEIFVDGAVARSFEGSFGAFTPTPSWRTIPLGVAGPIERIRIHAKTWAGNGAGLAEVKLVY